MEDDLLSPYQDNVLRMKAQIMQYIETYQPTYFELPGYIENALWYLVEHVVRDMNSKHLGVQIEDSRAASKAMTENIFAILEYDSRHKREVEALQLEIALLKTGAKRIAVDNALVSCLDTIGRMYSAEDVDTILAEVEATEKEPSWHWIVRLNDGSYVYTSAEAHYEAGEAVFGSGMHHSAESAEKAALLAPEKEFHGRLTRKSLLMQIREEIAYMHVEYAPLLTMMREL